MGGKITQLWEQAQGWSEAARDLAQARAWYTTSAQRGDHVAAPAMVALGRLYEQGLGVPVDRAQAIEWYRKAAATGNEDAKAALQRLGVQ